MNSRVISARCPRQHKASSTDDTLYWGGQPGLIAQGFRHLGTGALKGELS